MKVIKNKINLSYIIYFINIYKKLIFLIICFSLLYVSIVFSEEYINKKIGYSIDLPYGWKLLDDTKKDVASFSNANGSAVFQIFSFKGNTYNGSKKILDSFKNKLKAKGDAESFVFSDKDAIFSDLSFEPGSFKARGYCIFINDKKYDFALLAYSDLKNYKKNHDYILSVLNTFSIDKKGRMQPGPVSQYYYQDDLKRKKEVKLVVWGKTVETTIDYNEIETAQVLLEREARILIDLSKYQLKENDIIKMGNRYYNLIYRDNYSRVKSLSSLIIKTMGLNIKNKEETVKNLVFFIQNFKFEEKGIMKITTPIESLFSFSGDCDSRVLLLLIMLHQLGIDAIMLYSPKYQHAAIGINIKGSGTRVKFNGKNYLFVELTKVINIGQVLSETGDLTEWMPMKVGY